MHMLGVLVFVAIMASMVFLVAMSLYQLFLVLAYRRHRGDDPEPGQRFAPDALPTVTVQLPVYNEGVLSAQILRLAAELDYPHELLQIQFLDDSDDRITSECALRTISELRKTHPDIDFQYVRRVDRSGFKAGALKIGVERSSGEFLAIFDADFIIPKDYLQRTIHFFTDPQVGAVQARWDYLNQAKSVFTRLQANKLDAHQMFEQAARARMGLVSIFHGTAGVWRAETLAAAGGWNCISEVEDVEITVRAAIEDWRVIYLDHYRIFSELPENVNAFLRQQMRWRRGWTRVVRHYSKVIWSSDMPLSVRIDLLMRIHLTWGPVAALIATLGILPCFMLAASFGLLGWAIGLYSFSLLIALLIRYFESKTLQEDPLVRAPMDINPYLNALPLSYILFSLGMLWPLAQATLEGFGKGQIWEVTPKSGTTAGSAGHVAERRGRPPSYVLGTLALGAIGAVGSFYCLIQLNLLAAVFYGLLAVGCGLIGLMLLNFFGYQLGATKRLLLAIGG